MGYASIPVEDAAVVPVKGHPLTDKLPKLRLGDSLMRWLSGLRAQVDVAPARKAVTSLVGQTASIGVTPLAVDVVSRGLYRVSISARVTTPGGISSSLQVSILWNERTVTQIESSAAKVGNLTTTRAWLVVPIRSDQANPISFSTTYASAGSAMVYSVDVSVELVSSSDVA